MELSRRDFFKKSAAGALALGLAGQAQAMRHGPAALIAPEDAKPGGSRVKNMMVDEQGVHFLMSGIERSSTILFLSDTHFTVEDERGRAFYDFTKRMGGAAVEPQHYGESNGREQALLQSLERAKAAGADYVVLGGDMINFPSLASVKQLVRMLDASGLKWIYISGNHDWHYEGEEGTQEALRDKWIHSNMAELYQGRNPLYASVVLNGINLVLIDNSTNEITEEQWLFSRREVEKGMPVLLFMHIPLYLPGHPIDYACGNPDWNEAHDIYYEIERRPPWPEEGHTSVTYAFRDYVLAQSGVIGIFAGHTHAKAVDFCQGKMQYVAGANYTGDDVMIHIEKLD